MIKMIKRSLISQIPNYNNNLKNKSHKNYLKNKKSKWRTIANFVSKSSIYLLLDSIAELVAEAAALIVQLRSVLKV